MSLHETVSRVRVRYAETDQMGVVYYSNYFVWFEVGRTDLLRESGLSLSRARGRGREPAGDRGALRVSIARPGTMTSWRS